MRQMPPDNPFVDGEGFPVGHVWGNPRRNDDGEDDEIGRNGDCRRRNNEGRRNDENGEMVGANVFALRKLPEKPLKGRITRMGNTNWTPHYSLVKEQQRFRGFRIHDALKLGRRRLKEDKMVFRKDFSTPLLPQLQTCVYLREGVEVKRVVKPATPVHPSLGMTLKKPSEHRQMFRVPLASLPPNHNENPPKDSRTVCVNIWEEFLYGQLSLKPYAQHIQEDLGVTSYIRRFLVRFMPIIVANILVYCFYFTIFFASCCIYNMFWQLGIYLLLVDHLKIHERAYENKLEVKFTGSLFQGPAYTMVRNWCEHCNQIERAKVMRSLMKKMKSDIMAR